MLTNSFTWCHRNVQNSCTNTTSQSLAQNWQEGCQICPALSVLGPRPHHAATCRCIQTYNIHPAIKLHEHPARDIRVKLVIFLRNITPHSRMSTMASRGIPPTTHALVEGNSSSFPVRVPKTREARSDHLVIQWSRFRVFWRSVHSLTLDLFRNLLVGRKHGLAQGWDLLVVFCGYEFAKTVLGALWTGHREVLPPGGCCPVTFLLERLSDRTHLFEDWLKVSQRGSGACDPFTELEVC